VIDGETVILDRRSGRIHQLNETASFIWARCDGQLSMVDIGTHLAEAFDVAPAGAAHDVAATIDLFGELGLLDGRALGAPLASSPAPEPGRENGGSVR
jgi:hypothetical protein